MESKIEDNSNMIKEEIRYLSSDSKTNIHSIICYPKSKQYNYIIQIIHGKREYIERYLPFMEYLTTKGFIAVGNDHLGHGQSVNTIEDLGYMGEPNPDSLLLNDIHSLRLMMQKKYPNLPYFMCGHSMGSYLLREYLSKNSGEGLYGAIIMGSGYENRLKVSLGLKLCKLIAFFKGSRYYSKFFDNLTDGKQYKKFDMTKTDIYNSWLTSDPEKAKEYNEDNKRNFNFSLNAFMGMLQAVLFSCTPSNITKINKNLPVLFISGGDDPVGNFGEGVRKAANVFIESGIKDVTVKIYEKDRHEILSEVNRKEVFEDIENWMEDKIKCK